MPIKVFCQKPWLTVSTIFPSKSPSLGVCIAHPALLIPDGRSWKSTGARVQNILSHKYFKRVLTRDQDALEIAGCVSAIHWSIESFLVSMYAVPFTLSK